MKPHKQHQLNRSKEIEVPEGVFRLRYGLRSDFEELYAVHGVVRERVVNDYGRAIEDGYRQLTSPEYGWPRLPIPFDCNVAIRDLGVGRYGLANPGIDPSQLSGCYLALTSRALEADPELDSRFRFSITIHELVHLLQFPSPLYKSGNGVATPFVSDPNWWLHEATALALEFVLGGFPSKLLPHMWNWATSPNRSIQSDDLGYRAMPFILYLIEKLGMGFVPRLYFLSDSSPYRKTDNYATEGLEGTTFLDMQLRNEETDKGKMSISKSLIDFASIWALPANEMPRWARQILKVVGRPKLTEVRWVNERKAIIPPIERLGFRIISLPLAASRFSNGSIWSVSYAGTHEGNHTTKLCCQLVLRGNTDQISVHEGTSDCNRCIVRLPSIDCELTKRINLVVANTSIGSGRGAHDKTEVLVEQLQDG